MPKLTHDRIHAELLEYEEELRQLLHRLLGDVDYWYLPDDWTEKHASMDSYAIDNAGELKMTFRVVATITAYASDLENLVGIDLTTEDMTKIRILVTKIRLLRQLHEAGPQVKYAASKKS